MAHRRRRSRVLCAVRQRLGHAARRLRGLLHAGRGARRLTLRGRPTRRTRHPWTSADRRLPPHGALPALGEGHEGEVRLDASGTGRADRLAARRTGVSSPAGISLDNWLAAPYSHWSFQHVEDFVPTAVISRGTGPAAALPAASAPTAAIRLTSTDGVATTVGAVMASTATDGWAVAHRGSMAAE